MHAHEFRPLADTEFRPARDLFMRALNLPPVTDEMWKSVSRTSEPGRVFGGFLDGELAGTALTGTSALAVPGGAEVPAGAVTGVGVRADRTRRGVLTGLMRAQFDDTRERGEPVTMLHASEAVIYERFGYGVATRSRTVSLDRFRAALRPDAPRGGRMDLLDPEAARTVLPDVYRGLGLVRPGSIVRGDAWWDMNLAMAPRDAVAVVHYDPAGVPDGFLRYEPKSRDHRFDDGTVTLQVRDLVAGDAIAAAELWRFLFERDLTDRIVAVDRPLDEPVEWLMVDRRACRTTAVGDDLWLRLVDVAAALRARTFNAAEPVLVEVHDRFLPDNEGTYRIGPEDVERTEQRPQLSMDVSALAALYLGDVSVSALAAAGRVQVHEPAALPGADHLFTTDVVPWCGTPF
ncbi:GNAT family N-acetyltransferase [Saccharopolyspora sp. CA-218241]|uniref:GNAT family N-acetyltransferase n=1 Tax=Saccharopolyspora sp. CA-218241 TaxID=3240027 RepID=UPI003D97628F